VLVAHGSSQNREAAAPVHALAATLARRGWFARVEAAFWKQEPGVVPVVQNLQEPQVFLVPLMTGEGFFAEALIPEALGFGPLDGRAEGRARWFGAQWRCYCRPLGTHEGVADLLRALAAETVARHPFPRAPRPAETALVLVGHGTPRNPRSRQSVEAHAARLRRAGDYAEVHAVFLEEAPGVEAVYALTGQSAVVVVPVLIGQGDHAAIDIPVRLGEPESAVRARLAAGLPGWRNPTERHGRRLWCTDPVGRHPGIADLVLDRVREVAFSNFPPG
jgi:sirohydrochlorin cobaltochelatase